VWYKFTDVSEVLTASIVIIALMMEAACSLIMNLSIDKSATKLWTGAVTLCSWHMAQRLRAVHAGSCCAFLILCRRTLGQPTQAAAVAFQIHT
jgi:hypothetical protein